MINPAVASPTPTPIPGVELATEFLLDEDIVFEFDTSATPGAQVPPSPVTATLLEGSRFLGELREDAAVEFELILGEWEFMLPDGSTATSDDSVFEFDDLVGTDGGSYNAEGEVTHAPVPEPVTILGLLAVGGLGLGLKRKKQVS